MAWIEGRGLGILRMRDLMVKRGLRPPQLDVEGTYLQVTFVGEEHAWRNVRVAPDLLNKLEELEQKILRRIMEKGRVTTRECARKFKVDVATARRHLGRLRSREIIESRGSGSKIHYLLKGS